MKSLLHTNFDEEKQSAIVLESGADDLDTRTAYELATGFGIAVESEADAEAKLLAIRECQISTEAGSVRISNDTWAKIYLFTTHVCIEQRAFMMFMRRKTIPLSEVLGLVYSEEERSKKSGKGGSKPPNPSLADDGSLLRHVDLEMKGGSIRLAMAASQCDDFAREVERARLKSLEMTQTALGYGEDVAAAPAARG